MSILKALTRGTASSALSANVMIAMDDTQTDRSLFPVPAADVGSIAIGTDLTRHTSDSKFGSGCLRLECTGASTRDYIIALPGSTDIRSGIGTGAYTISMWLKQGASYNNVGNWSFMLGESALGTEKVGLKVNDDFIKTWINGTNYDSSTAVFSSANGAWKHFAMCRSGGVTSAWYDGTRMVNQQTDTFDFNNLIDFVFGFSAGGNRGSILVDDCVLLNVAQWSPSSSTITVPTAALGA